VAIENPLSEDQSLMRTTLLGSLLDAAGYNAARGAGDLRLFESGAVYRPGDESHHLGALLAGAARPATWREPAPHQADLFAVKGVLAAVLDTLRVPWSLAAEIEPFLHPGRAAILHAGDVAIGWLGELHPLVAGEWGLDRAAAFELDLDTVAAAADALPVYSDLPSFPDVREDLAVVVGDDVPAARVLEVARRAGGAMLAAAEVFDVYRGPQIGEGKVSLALRLAFRASDRTLTDEEAAERRETIIATLAGELGAAPRA
jgi:phenylalanyl-tRNA synthetase beta chain